MIKHGTFTKDGKELDDGYSKRKGTLPFQKI